MLAQLRQRTKTILWIVIVAFVGLMVFVWGMNLKSRGGPEAGVVGRVGNRRITLDEYRNELANQRAVYRSQNRRIDSQAEREIADQAWENIVQRYLLWQEATKRNLQPTPDELVRAMETNPPAFIRSQPIFQTDSLYDHQKYLQALTDPRFAVQMESYFRANLPIQKLQDYVTASVRVTTEEARRLVAMLEEKVTISYVVVDPMSVKQDLPDPSDEELLAYYEENSEDFRAPEKRKLRLVAVPKNPSAEDEEFARQRIEEAFDLIEAGEPFDEIAQEYSDDERTASKGGDMGWVKQGMLEAPLDSVVFSLSPGQMSKVVKTRSGFHLVRVEERKVEDGVEKARLSYIFVRLEPSPLTLEEIRQNAMDLAKLASRKGLEPAAAEFGFEVTESSPLAKEQLRPIYGWKAEDADAVFQAEIGRILGPHEGTKAFYVVEITEIIPSRIPPLEEIKSSVLSRYRYKKRKELARSIAEKVYARISKGSSLEAAARAEGLEVKKTAPFGRRSTVHGIGAENTVIATAFALEKGETSGILEHGGRFYIIRVDEKQPLDEDRFSSELQNLKFSLLNTKKQMFISRWYHRLKENTKIEDYRSFGSTY